MNEFLSATIISSGNEYHSIFSFSCCCFISFFFHRLDKAFTRPPHAVHAFQIYYWFLIFFFFFFVVAKNTSRANGCRRPTSKAAAQIPIKNYYVLFCHIRSPSSVRTRHNMITYRRAQTTKTKWKQQQYNNNNEKRQKKKFEFQFREATIKSTNKQNKKQEQKKRFEWNQ